MNKQYKQLKKEMEEVHEALMTINKFVQKLYSELDKMEEKNVS